MENETNSEQNNAFKLSLFCHPRLLSTAQIKVKNNMRERITKRDTKVVIDIECGPIIQRTVPFSNCWQKNAFFSPLKARGDVSYVAEIQNSANFM